MPERVYSALNLGGTSRVTEPERFAAANRANDLASMIQRDALAESARQFNANFSDRANDRAMQERIQGTFNDRAGLSYGLQGLQNEGQLGAIRESGSINRDLARIGNEIPMARLDMERTQYSEGAPLRQAESGARIGALTRQGQIDDLVQEQLVGALGGGGVQGLGKDQLRALQTLTAIRSGGKIPDFGAEDEEAQLRQLRLKQMMQADAEAEAIRRRNAGLPVQPGILPNRTPDEIVTNSLAFPGKVDEIARAFSAQDNVTAEDMAGSVQPMIAALQKELVNQGARPDEALAYIRQLLDKKIGTINFGNAPISSLIDTFLPGQPVGNALYALPEAREMLGLSRYGG